MVMDMSITIPINPARTLLERMCSGTKGLAVLTGYAGIFLSLELNCRSYDISRDAIHIGKNPAFLEQIFNGQNRYARAISAPGRHLAKALHHIGDPHTLELWKKASLLVEYDSAGIFPTSNIAVCGAPEFK